LNWTMFHNGHRSRSPRDVVPRSVVAGGRCETLGSVLTTRGLVHVSCQSSSSSSSVACVLAASTRRFWDVCTHRCRAQRPTHPPRLTHCESPRTPCPRITLRDERAPPEEAGFLGKSRGSSLCAKAGQRRRSSRYADKKGRYPREAFVEGHVSSSSELERITGLLLRLTSRRVTSERAPVQRHEFHERYERMRLLLDERSALSLCRRASAPPQAAQPDSRYRRCAWRGAARRRGWS
jgi:hypothetical protein